MKRLLLGSLLSCMVISRLFAAASNSREDAERENARNLQKLEKLCAVSLQERLIKDLIDAKIIELNGKIAPDYLQKSEYHFEASDEAVFYREVYQSCIQVAVQHVKELMPHLNLVGPAVDDIVNRYAQKLLRKWSREVWWKSKANIGTTMHTTYIFPTVQHIESEVRRHLREDLRDLLLPHGKFWSNPDVIRGHHRGVSREYGYTVKWSASAADAVKDKIDATLRAYADREEYPIEQRKDLMLRRKLLMPIADRAKALIDALDNRIKQREDHLREAQKQAEQLWAEEQAAITARAVSTGISLSFADRFRIKNGPMGYRAFINSGSSLRDVFITEIVRVVDGVEPRIGISDPTPQMEAPSGMYISGFNN